MTDPILQLWIGVTIMVFGACWYFKGKDITFLITGGRD